MKTISTIFILSSLALVGCQEKVEPKKAPVKAVNAPASQAKKAPASKPVKPQTLFVFPQNNSKVFEEFNVVMGVRGMKVSPAGENIDNKMMGHHHLIIDGGPIAKGQAVPKDATHIHFGKGQTSTRLKLKPGKHTVTMQFADGNHLSYGPEMSKTINVNVIAQPKTGVMFKNVKDGDTISSPAKLEFGVAGFEISPAGKEILNKTSGHHHLIIDGKPVPAGSAVAANKTHIHFGKGQTETSVELTPGKHTLTLQLADALHLSYGEKMSQTINVTVK